jgi:hypothetical protein
MAAIGTGLLLSGPAGSATPSSDPLSRMFAWWDVAFRQKDGFTAEAFRRYFTDDATLTLEGKTVIHGIPEWVEHFRTIQASGREVEIVVPFKQVFRSGDRIFTYHVIRSRGHGEVSCSLAATPHCGAARSYRSRWSEPRSMPRRVARSPIAGLNKRTTPRTTRSGEGRNIMPPKIVGDRQRGLSCGIQERRGISGAAP